jgi:hypothetical protein
MIFSFSLFSLPPNFNSLNYFFWYYPLYFQVAWFPKRLLINLRQILTFWSEVLTVCAIAWLPSLGLQPFLPIWPWASDLASSCLSFLFCGVSSEDIQVIELLGGSKCLVQRTCPVSGSSVSFCNYQGRRGFYPCPSFHLHALQVFIRWISGVNFINTA